jgi:hypothetical protein
MGQGTEEVCNTPTPPHTPDTTSCEQVTPMLVAAKDPCNTQAADPFVALGRQKMSDPLETQATPTNLISLIRPSSDTEQVGEGLPLIPDLDCMQTRFDFARPLLHPRRRQAGCLQGCRPVLLPKAELERARKRKGRTDQPVVLKSSLLDHEVMLRNDDDLKATSIGLPTIPDGVDLKQRCRMLKPRWR